MANLWHVIADQISHDPEQHLTCSMKLVLEESGL